jgi:hypothetical protein
LFDNSKHEQNDTYPDLMRKLSSARRSSPAFSLSGEVNLEAFEVRVNEVLGAADMATLLGFFDMLSILGVIGRFRVLGAGRMLAHSSPTSARVIPGGFCSWMVVEGGFGSLTVNEWHFSHAVDFHGVFR